MTRRSDDSLVLPAPWSRAIEEEITLLKRSTWSDTYLAKVKGTDTEVFIKDFPLHTVAAEHAANAEAMFMERFRLADVVTLWDAAVAHDDDMPHVVLVTEAADSDLFKAIAKHTDDMPASVRIRLAVQILRAVAAIAEKGCIHRNIKAESILVFGDCTDPEGCNAKLWDFRLVEDLEKLGGKHPRIAGSRWYIAPEVWAGKGDLSKSDVWSTGIVLYALFVGHLPSAFYRPEFNEVDPAFAEEDPLKTFVPNKFDINEDRHWKRLKTEDPDIASLIGRMLTKPVSPRPTAAAALEAIMAIADARGVEVPMQRPAPVPPEWKAQDQFAA